jgi:hypothetical protein
MANLKRSFQRGRMNKSDDLRLIPDGEYTNALNVRVNSTEGQAAGIVENAKGNTQLTTVDAPYVQVSPRDDGSIALSASARCIGAFNDDAKETIYWFIHDGNNTSTSSGKVDLIVSYNVNTDSLTYHVVSISTLNFAYTNLITGVNKVGNLLFFTDDRNPPRRIDVTRNYGLPTGTITPAQITADTLTEDDISVIVKPPNAAPTLTLIDNGSEENYMEDTFISFAYRYRYRDGEYSALSQFSPVAFEPGSFSIDPSTMLNSGMLNRHNAVQVAIDAGPANVVSVDVCFKLADSTVINVIDSFDKTEYGWPNNSSQTVVFSNSKIFTVLPSSELLRLYDNVPRFAKAQTIIGRRLIYGNYVDGYDIKDLNGDTVHLEFGSELVSEDVGFNSYNTSYEQENYTLGGYTYTPPGSDNAIAIFDLSGFPTDSTGRLIAGSRISIQFNISSGAVQDSAGSASATPVAQNPITLDFQFTLQFGYTSLTALVTSSEFSKAIGTLPAYFNAPGSCSTGTSLVDQFHCAITADTGFTLEDSGRLALGEGFKVYAPGTTAGGTTLSSTQFGVWINAVQYNRTSDNAKFYEYFKITSADLTSTTVSSLKSLHSNRDYDLAIIYMDEYKRSSTALTSEENTVFVPPSASILKNSIKATIPASMLAPSWATSYKWALKPSKANYETIIARFFYDEPLDNSVWVKLDGESQNKVEVGDELIVKIDSGGPVLDEVVATVREKDTKAENFISSTSVTELAGTYMNLLPSGWAANFNPDNFKSAGSIKASTRNDNEPSNFEGTDTATGFGEDAINLVVEDNTQYPILMYPCHDVSGSTYTRWEVPAGSVVKISIKLRRPGRGSKVDETCRFDLEYVSQNSYTNLSSFFVGETVDLANGFTDESGNNTFTFTSGITQLTSGTADSIIGVTPTGFSNQFGFFTTGASTTDLFFGIRSGIGRLNKRESKITCEISVTQANDILVFETQPSDASPDIFYEGDEEFSIDTTTGYHSGNVQTQTASLPSISNLSFFNCFAFGNGVESYKIRDSIIGNFFELGQRTTAVSNQEYKQADRFASLTYSGVFNEESNINKLNEFNLGLLNFRDISIEFGEIQVLDGRADNMLVLQEDKISYILFEKDLLSDLSGGGALTSVPTVLGQQIARIEEYGISNNPESYVKWGYDKFFTDVKRNAVIQLRGSGTSEALNVISDNKLRSFFRDEFRDSVDKQKLGGYDPYMNEYALSINDRSLFVPEKCLDAGSSPIVVVGPTGEKEYCITLGTQVGQVNIDLTNNSSDPISVVYDWDGPSQPISVPSGPTTISFAKDDPNPTTMTLRIDSGSSAADYRFAVNKPAATQITIRSISLTTQQNAGQFIHSEWYWTKGTYSSRIHNELVTFASGSGNLVSSNNSYVGDEGVGIFPANGVALGYMAAHKTGFDNFDFDSSNNSFRYLRTDTVYDPTDATELQNLITASTAATPITQSGNRYIANFTVPATGEYLYLIYDYRNITSISLDDASTATLVCCNP